MRINIDVGVRGQGGREGSGAGRGTGQNKIRDFEREIQDAGVEAVRAFRAQRAAEKTAQREINRYMQESSRERIQQQREEERQRPRSFGARLNTFARSTRFGSGGVAPLAGRAMDVIGMSMQATGPVGIGVAAAVAFTRGIQRATDELHRFSGAVQMSGGTVGQVAGLAAAGIPAGEIAGRSASVRESRANNGFAMMFGQRFGLGFELGRPFGDTNEAADLKRLVDALRKMTPGSPEQLRLARVFGQEDLLTTVNVSPFVRQTQDRLAGQMAGFYGNQQQGANDVVAGQANFNQALNNFWVGTGMQDWAARALNAGTRTVSGAIDPFQFPITDRRFWFGEMFGDDMSGGAEKTGEDKLSEAAKDLKDAARYITGQGEYGTSSRAGGNLSRIPWRGVLTDDAFRREATQRGMTG